MRTRNKTILAAITHRNVPARRPTSSKSSSTNDSLTTPCTKSTTPGSTTAGHLTRPAKRRTRQPQRVFRYSHLDAPFPPFLSLFTCENKRSRSKSVGSRPKTRTVPRPAGRGSSITIAASGGQKSLKRTPTHRPNTGLLTQAFITCRTCKIPFHTSE